MGRVHDKKSFDLIHYSNECSNDLLETTALIRNIEFFTCCSQER